MEIEARRSIFNRLGRPYFKNRVCSFWLQGKCNRNPCRFLHLDFPNSQPKNEESYDRRHHHHRSNRLKYSWRNANQSTSENATDSASVSKNVTLSSSTSFEVDNGHEKKEKVLTPRSMSSEVDNGHEKKEMVLTPESTSSVAGSCKNPQNLCQYWVAGNCVHGDKCKDLHSWFSGSGFSMLAKLERHNKAVTGIALPSGSDKLFSGSTDESVCVWDCNTGQCVSSLKLDGEIGSLITEGVWVFVGLKNAIKVWNIQTMSERVLTGPNGLVNAMDTGDDLLFAVVEEDGCILAWEINSESVYPKATLKGHELAVLSLIVGAGRLYSGSKDGTIRVWDLKTLLCVETVQGHANFVTSLICWDRFLISGSLDGTLKVWGATETGSLEVQHEVKEESGIVTLKGVHDAVAKPVLFCLSKDNTVRLYDLPFFSERGRIFSKNEVQSLQTVEMSSGGLFFIGDCTGELSVWRLLGESREEAGHSCGGSGSSIPEPVSGATQESIGSGHPKHHNEVFKDVRDSSNTLISPELELTPTLPAYL